jgi:iron complex transport system ATP-binding protein
LKSIEVANVDFSYNSSFFFKNLILEIKKGDMVGIIGPNGCGKTTLINLIRGYLSPNSGKILIFGQNVEKFDRIERSKKISLVPQESKTSFNFTALEIVLMGRYPFQRYSSFESDEDFALAMEALSLTNTTRFANQYFWRLSGGEKQRVILARAIAQQAEIILLDEPTSSLDIKQSYNIYKVIAKLNKTKGVTIVTATHDIELARKFCHRIIMMKEGKIYGDGIPEAIFIEKRINDLYDIDI